MKIDGLGKTYGNRFPETNGQVTTSDSTTGKKYSYIVVSNVEERNAIPVSERKLGAAVSIAGVVKKFTSVDIDEWNDTSNWVKLDIQLEEDFTFTLDAHGASKDDVISANGINTILDVIKKAWSPFVGNQLTSITAYVDEFLTPISVYEVGTYVDLRAVKVEYDLNTANAGISDISIYYQNSPLAIGYQTFVQQSNPERPYEYYKTLGSTIIVGHAVGSASITAKATYIDDRGYPLATNSITDSLSFKLNRFYLSSPLENMTSDAARAGNREFDDNKGGSVFLNIPAGEYGWVVQPVSWGEISIFAGGFQAATIDPEIIDLKLENGVLIPYYAYRLRYAGTGEVTLTLV